MNIFKIRICDFDIDIPYENTSELTKEYLAQMQIQAWEEYDKRTILIRRNG